MVPVHGQGRGRVGESGRAGAGEHDREWKNSEFVRIAIREIS